MTSTTNLILAISVMLAVNVALVFFQGAVSEVNPSGSQFFNSSNSPYGNYVVNGTFQGDDSFLPADDSVEGDTSGNIFTDTYAKIKSWSQTVLAPFKFLSNILGQPYGFLKDIGLPMSIALAFQVFWFMFAIIIIVSWWMGR
jgi:hypothetical protein